MTANCYTEELGYLKGINVSDKEKIILIENLYRLAHMNFNKFIENDGQIIY